MSLSQMGHRHLLIVRSPALASRHQTALPDSGDGTGGVGAAVTAASLRPRLCCALWAAPLPCPKSNPLGTFPKSPSISLLKERSAFYREN